MKNVNPLEQKNPKMKMPNPAGKIFKAIFVHNIGLKLLSIGLSVVLWVIAVGL